MTGLTRYPIVIRAADAPPAPSGVAAVELVLDEDEPAASVIDALRAHGLRDKDLQRHTAVFLAPESSSGAVRDSLVLYAVLYGLTERLIHVYADDEIQDVERLFGMGTKLTMRVRQPGSLMWAQVGGRPAEGIPTVHIDAPRRELVSPRSAMVISQAARLRMVPPSESASDAFALLALVAGLRRRDEEVRFPFLSTGAEPVPVTKNDPLQGIDLEKIRKQADAFRRNPRAGGRAHDIVAREPVSAHNNLLTEANAAEIRTVLERLGSSPDEEDRWRCPRSHHRYPRYPNDRYLDFSGDNRVRCRQCDREMTGPVRLVVAARDITPDEAARFILERNGADLTGCAVTAIVESKRRNDYHCVVHDPVTGDHLTASLPIDSATKKHDYRAAPSAGDRIVALVTGTHREPGGAVRLTLSAKDAALVERLLAGFVPELASGDIVVKKTVRVAGARTKIAVASTVRGLDAKGACIGVDESRVTRAREVLNRSALNGAPDEGERLEIILYASRRETFLLEAFQPARAVVGFKIDAGNAVVAAKDYALGGFIGRGGLNAELVGKLTGLNVRVVRADADLDAEIRNLRAERADRSRARPGSRDPGPGRARPPVS